MNNRYVLFTMSSLSVVGSTREGVPVMLLKEGTSQTRGRNALNSNIEAAKIIASMLKSGLGPRGMDKIGKAGENEVGDGTTSSAIIAGSLMENAEKLVNRGIHPTVIVDGYRKAMRQAIDTLHKTAE